MYLYIVYDTYFIFVAVYDDEDDAREHVKTDPKRYWYHTIPLKVVCKEQ